MALRSGKVTPGWGSVTPARGWATAVQARAAPLDVGFLSTAIADVPAGVDVLRLESGEPTDLGRIRRGAKVGGLLGVETARAYATKAANVARSPETSD